MATTMQLDSVLIPQEQIATRVREMAERLRERLGESDADGDVRIVGLLRGAIFFFVDLLRAMDHPDVAIDLMRASSYADAAHAASGNSGTDATTSAGTVRFDERMVPGEIRGQRVVLVDDIIDTGRTLKTLHDALLEAGAREVISVVLLDKPARREVSFGADLVGFEIPDHFVVGYGLDCGGRFRLLPDICIVRADEN